MGKNKKRNQASSKNDDEKTLDVRDVVEAFINLHPRFRSDKSILQTTIEEMNLKYFDKNDHKLIAEIMDKITQYKISQMVDESSENNAIEESIDDESIDEDESSES